MHMNNLRDELHGLAKTKGWCDQKEPDLTICCSCTGHLRFADAITAANSKSRSHVVAG